MFLSISLHFLFGCISSIQSSKREGRGYEDLGISYCHTQGMKPTNVTINDIVTSSRGSEDQKLIIVIYWTKLIQKPECVDEMEISLGHISRSIDNPYDKEV